MRVDEWAQELAETVARGWGGLATMTVAACANAAASEEVIATARKTVAAAGWDFYEIDARSTFGYPARLQDAGYVILRDIRVPLRTGGGASKRIPTSDPEEPSDRDCRSPVSRKILFTCSACGMRAWSVEHISWNGI